MLPICWLCKGNASEAPSISWNFQIRNCSFVGLPFAQLNIKTCLFLFLCGSIHDASAGRNEQQAEQTQEVGDQE